MRYSVLTVAPGRFAFVLLRRGRIVEPLFGSALFGVVYPTTNVATNQSPAMFVDAFSPTFKLHGRALPGSLLPWTFGTNLDVLLISMLDRWIGGYSSTSDRTGPSGYRWLPNQSIRQRPLGLLMMSPSFPCRVTTRRRVAEPRLD